MQRSSIARPVVDASLAPVQPLATQAGQDSQVIIEGWVLKKRRKKMQGFARRYFVLYQSGILSYSVHPGEPPRDQILLPQAAIATAVGRKDIHVDSSTATFHIKCLSADDFQRWMSAFRTFTASDTATVGRRSSASRTSRSTPRVGSYNRTGPLLDEIGNTITELQEAFISLLDEDAKRRQAASTKANQHSKDHSAAKLSIFKHRKSIHGHSTAASQDTASDDFLNPDGTPALSPAMQRLQTGFQSLKYQHSALVQNIYSGPEQGHSLRSSPLLATAKEEDELRSPTPTHSTLGKASLRSHRFSVQSESSVWYDAPEEYDVAEEFIMDESAADDSQASKLSDEASLVTASEAGEESSHSSESESDTEDDIPVEPTKPRPASPDHVETITRRTELPSPTVGDEGSLFSVLKKNVGKDLAQVALPVSFNEPLTLLQRMAEELEYYDLLSRAVKSEDPVERLCYVTAFAVSAYASTKHRSGRKGFNPMLAETFEDSRMRFIAEKVSHHPVILAFHAEGDGWELYATSSGKTKFWGKSLEIIPQGATHLIIGNDHYEWTKPSSFMRNLMMGTKYLEHCGKMVIENSTTGARCVMEFKEGGYWGVSNQVAGVVYSPQGETVSRLEGKWDEQVVQKLDASTLRVLWRIAPFPRNAPEYYGFTSFGITLNEITSDIANKLPPTDSRLRPDVRALEEGNLDLAEHEKTRIEELQRERRKRGEERKPRWFKKVGEEWQYVGGYWEERARGWDGVEPLW